MRRLSLALCCALVVLFSSTLMAGQRQTVAIGVCMSLTGEFGEYGKVYLPGIRLAVDVYNASPDREYDLKLIIRDDMSRAGIATAIIAELADTEQVVAIIGSTTSVVTMAMREETMKRGVVMITPSATNALLGMHNDGVVRVLFNDAFQGEALARFSREHFKFSRAAVLLNTRHDYANAIEAAFTKRFTADGGTVWREVFAANSSAVENYDFRPALRRIMESGAETVLIPSYAIDVTTILRQAQELGMKQRFCGGDAWHHQETLLASGNALEGAYYTCVLDANVRSEESDRFRGLLENTNYEADLASAQGYDAVLILLEALKRGPTREDIFRGVYDIKDLPLVTGKLTMDKTEGSKTAAAIVQVVRDKYGMFVTEVVDTVAP